MLAETDLTVLIPWILYPWLAVSIGVYAYRFYKKRSGKVDAEPSAPDTANPHAPPAVSPTEPSNGTSIVDAVIREELAARQAESTRAPEQGSTRAGLFAPSGPPEATGTRVPVDEALDGIRLPCELVPIDSESAGPHRVCFVTTGFDPAAVGAALGDELERLGFALQSESEASVWATKPTASVRVRIHPDARAARGETGPLFPAAPGNAVAVEFTT